jgi:ankyrin repeat protein
MASTSEELFDAIEADDAHRVRHLLSDDPSLAEARDHHGVSALMRAVYRWEPGTIGVIREHVADLDVFEAAAVGEGTRLRELLEADPGLASAYSADGFTALHFAAFFGNDDEVEALLASGAAVDALGRGWMTGTALHSAVSRKRSPIVRRLLAEGANPNARQSAGWTPLHSAAHNGDLESVEALLAAGADPAATNDEGRSVQALAEERGDEPTIERIRSAVQASP